MVTIPGIAKVRKVINEWVAYYPRIIKVCLFGSYVKRDKPVVGDIDIAMEISHKEGDTVFGFWCSEKDRMEKQLTHFLNYKADLHRSDGERTPTIKKGLDEGSILIYERVPRGAV